MPTPAPTIDNLMKVSLTVESGDVGTEDDTGSPFEFIYGIGPGGLTPFEKALYGKRVGERVQIDIPATDYCESVGHLDLPLRRPTGIMAPISMRVTVQGIAKARDQEVIKAMASGVSCGDCGCGCGGH
jgi:hypothetical protein